VSEPLLLFTWLWFQQPAMCGYGADKVNLWAAQLRRNLTIPHRLACVTDHPQGIDSSIEIIPMQRDFTDVRNDRWQEAQRRPQCYRRLALFAPDAEQRFGAKRFVSMDLDMIVTSNLDPLFDHDDDFRILRGSDHSRPFNGSMLQMNAGARPKVFTEFSVEGAAESRRKYVGSDQAWMCHALSRKERTWSYMQGVHFYKASHRFMDRVPKGMRLIFFPGAPKPWNLPNWSLLGSLISEAQAA
jgi:hypothetical protein